MTGIISGSSSSPDDALEMSDLKTFARDLVGQMEKDLGTKLDWVGVDHWNTEHPHVHVIVRGVARRRREPRHLPRLHQGGHARPARDLITQELGCAPTTDIRRALERQVEAERWTKLDRQLARASTDARRHRSGAASRPPAR